MKFFAFNWFVTISAGFALAASTAAAAQEQAPKAGEQPPAVKEIKGTITSMDSSCASFTLDVSTDDKDTDTPFFKDGDHGSWVREPEGCSIAFGPEEKVLLKLGMIVTVRYVVQQDKNMVRGFVLAPAALSGPAPCKNPQTSADGVYKVGCGIPEPKCLYCPQPPYDTHARKKRIQGTVEVELVILKDGRVSEARVVKSVDEVLDKATLDTVRKWRFEPIIGPGGKPVEVVLTAQVNFRLL